MKPDVLEISKTNPSAVMLHNNVAELRLLVDTFTRVWSSGGQANLSLQTKDSQMWAKLDLQLGPAGGRRPGPPEAEGRAGGEPQNYQAQPDFPPHPLLGNLQSDGKDCQLGLATLAISCCRPSRETWIRTLCWSSRSRKQSWKMPAT